MYKIVSPHRKVVFSVNIVVMMSVCLSMTLEYEIPVRDGRGCPVDEWRLGGWAMFCSKSPFGGEWVVV